MSLFSLILPFNSVFMFVGILRRLRYTEKIYHDTDIPSTSCWFCY